MRRVKLVPDHYYHIYNRGIAESKIFFQVRNWGYFLQQWRKYCLPEYAETIAYCLMPTHYHFLLYIKTEDFGHKVMHPFVTSYAKAINKQERRSGHLFQGAFQAKLVDTNAYLSHLTRYIHLNPVEASYVDHPGDWEYSSYLEYAGLRDGILPKPDIVLENFNDRADYIAFVEDGVQDLRPIMKWMLD